MPKLRGSQAVEFSVLSLPGWTVERGRSNTHRSEAARREPVSFSRAGKGLWKSKPGKRYRIAIEGGVVQDLLYAGDNFVCAWRTFPPV